MSTKVCRGRIRQAEWCPKVSDPNFRTVHLADLYTRYFADNIRDDYANGQLDAQVETVLSEMKELAIYGV